MRRASAHEDSGGSTARPVNGELMSNADLNSLLVKVARRAEKATDEVLQEAFVPVRALLSYLESPEHQVLFGRRGTGKTHLMRYLQAQRASAGALSVYVDLRSIGSAEDLTGQRADFAEGATGLLVDLIEHVHRQLYEQVLEDRWAHQLTEISEGLDALADAATHVRVVGETEVERQQEDTSAAERTRGAGLAAGPQPSASWQHGSRRRREQRKVERRLSRGREAHHVLLGPLATAVRRLADALGEGELWVFIDEWSALPADLQPLMADLLRRTFMPARGVVVKISAIHGRSRFSDDNGPGGAAVGLELGADTAASLDLDDFLLFRNDAAATIDFYATLLFRHLSAAGHRLPASDPMAGITRPTQLLGLLFADRASFHNLVLGAEGVPRDALQIAGLAASAAFDAPIAATHVAAATRDFFLRDKQGHLGREAQKVFANLIDQCARQQSRLIPLRRDGESDEDIIQRLYDARLIHRVRQGISLDPRHPAEAYDVYVVDYGCFLGLLASGRIRATQDGLDPSARFADANEIELRGGTFVHRPRGWYRTS